jgi:type IV pilus assembly protein PilB
MQTFSQYLIQKNIAEGSTLPSLKDEAEKQGLSLAQLFERQNKMPAKTITQALSQITQLPCTDISSLQIEDMETKSFSSAQLQQWQAMLFNKDDTVLLLMTDPTRYEIIHQVTLKTKKTVRPQLIAFHDFKNLLSNLHLHPSKQNTQKTAHSTAFDAPSTDTSMKHLQAIFIDAVNREASDIHIEPFQQYINIRFRLQGILMMIQKHPTSIATQLVNQIKILSKLDITETRLPQDGQCQLTLNNKTINMRISTCPTIYGEKVVIRLLKSSQEKTLPKDIGFDAKELALFSTAIQKPQGLVLVTGPTGSGKTSTLYSAIHQLNSPQKNISTVEDPVEVQIDGINQVNIKPIIGLTFDKILKTFLRQDPDIIMLGEIRDHETAKIAIKAAQTGHLVLSTLHSNDSMQSISRLKNLGINDFDIKESLNITIAQRLLRKLCDHCKKAIESSAQEQTFQAHGCDRCQQGYTSRLPVFEMVTYDKTSEQYIQHNTLEEQALEKVTQGQTTLDEVQRVIA